MTTPDLTLASPGGGSRLSSGGMRCRKLFGAGGRSPTTSTWSCAGKRKELTVVVSQAPHPRPLAGPSHSPPPIPCESPTANSPSIGPTPTACFSSSGSTSARSLKTRPHLQPDVQRRSTPRRTVRQTFRGVERPRLSRGMEGRVRLLCLGEREPSLPPIACLLRTGRSSDILSPGNRSTPGVRPALVGRGPPCRTPGHGRSPTSRDVEGMYPLGRCLSSRPDVQSVAPMSSRDRQIP